MSGPFTSKSTVIKEKSNDEIDIEGEGSKGKEVIYKKKKILCMLTLPALNMRWSLEEFESFGVQRVQMRVYVEDFL